MTRRLTLRIIEIQSFHRGFRLTFHSLKRTRVVDRDEFLVEAARGKSVLHLGCADASHVGRRISDGTLLHSRLAVVASNIVGVDKDEDGVGLLKGMGFEDIVLGDVEKLSELALGRDFEMVLAGEILEHLPNPGLCLSGAKDLLRMDGCLVVTVPNAFAIKGFLRMIGGTELVHPEHLFYFSETTLRKLILRAGFREMSHVYYVSSPATRVRQILDTMVFGPIRRFAPYVSDGLILKCQPL